MTSDLSLDAVFSALADPTRRAILARLVEGEASVAELAQPFDLTVRAISKHVAVLEHAGFVQKSNQAQRRVSRIEVGPLREIDLWLDSYRALWEQRFDNMEAILDEGRGK